jgi:hypothetical protein
MTYVLNRNDRPYWYVQLWFVMCSEVDMQVIEIRKIIRYDHESVYTYIQRSNVHMTISPPTDFVNADRHAGQYHKILRRHIIALATFPLPLNYMFQHERFLGSLDFILYVVQDLFLHCIALAVNKLMVGSIHVLFQRKISFCTKSCL